jgi:N-methylhydantoinase B
MMPFRRMAAGDVIRMIAPSGGGYGPPLERDPALVRADVVRGFLGADAAREDYGVVLGPPPELAIDEATTQTERTQA